MGTTPHGYPYPDRSDPVGNGDLAIRALAEYTDSQVGVMAGGTATIQLTADATRTVGITFPLNRFATPPRVIATCSHSKYIATVQSITTAGATLTIRQYEAQANSGYVEIYWQAFA